MPGIEKLTRSFPNLYTRNTAASLNGQVGAVLATFVGHLDIQHNKILVHAHVVGILVS
jgi:hypothetical protein